MRTWQGVAAFVLILGASPASGQLVRAFVSISGLDTNPCTRQQPCRSVGTALAAIQNGGEVIPLDTGGYGPFTIDRAAKVIAPAAVHAAVTATSGTAINVQAGPDETVVLRGLYLNSQGATTGILFGMGGVLHVESCVVHGFTTQNLRVARTVASQPAQLFVSNSTFRQTAGVGNGMVLTSSQGSSAIEAAVFRSRFENGNNGIFATGRSSLAAAASVFSGNVTGVRVSANFSVATDVSVVDSRLVNNSDSGLSTALSGTGTVNVRLARNTISGNDRGVRVSASTTVASTQDNTIAGNTTSDVTGTLTTYAPF